jgi:hypothetical protein
MGLPEQTRQTGSFAGEWLCPGLWVLETWWQSLEWVVSSPLAGYVCCAAAARRVVLRSAAQGQQVQVLLADWQRTVSLALTGDLIGPGRCWSTGVVMLVSYFRRGLSALARWQYRPLDG